MNSERWERSNRSTARLWRLSPGGGTLLSGKLVAATHPCSRKFDPC
jgi:hypothetical protein